MTFAYSSNRITQTGTDTSLAGLSGLTGVTVTDFGTNSGGYKLYVFSGTTFRIDGNLSFNANTERIIFASNVGGEALLIFGTLTIDGTQTFNSTSVGFQYFALTFLHNGQFCCNDFDASIRVIGTFNLIRAAVYTNYLMFWAIGSTITITEGALVSSRTSGSDVIRVRNSCSNLTINGCFLSNISLDFFRAPIALSNLIWKGSNRAFELVSTYFGFGTDSQVVFQGLTISGTSYDISNYAQANLLLRNPPQNAKYKIAHDELSASGGFTQVTCQASLKLKRSDTGAFLTSGSYFVRDSNNGSRANGTLFTGAVVNFTNDRTYFSNVAGSGVFAQQEILCYVVRGGTPTNFSSLAYDFRSTNNDETNQFNFIFAAYGYLPLVQKLALFGTASGAAFSSEISVLTDVRITQNNTATVTGYTTQAASRFEDIYDYSALNKTLSAGIEFPAANTRIFESSDGKNGTLNYNLTIDSGLTGININHASSLLTIKALTVASSTYTDVSIAAGKNITLAQSGNYNLPVFSISSTGIVTVAPGATNLQGWTFASGATINASSGTATVTVDSVTGITAGAGVTLQTPVNSISISGIPTGANAILGVIDLTTMTQTFPTITGSTATIVTDPARNYFIACDARGYLRQTVTLAGNTPAFAFNLTNFRALYEAGVPGADITLNTSTFVVTVGDSIPLLTLATVFRAIEDLLATPEAVFFSTPPYPVIVSTGTGAARQYLFFPYDTAAGTPNPVRIKPKTTNTIDPTLTDFVVVHEGSTAPLFSIFDFTSAGGRTIRFQTEAVAASVVVSGSGALTTDQANQLAALNATLQSSGVFSTAALVNAPSGGSGGLDAAGVRSAIGLAAANLDTQLTGINTNVDQIPTTDYAPNITAIKAKTDQLAFTTAGRVDSTAVTVTDKTGYSLSSTQTFNLTGNISGSVGSVTAAIVLPTIPTNWLTAAGLASDAVSEIQAGLSTYAGTDTAGTTTLLSRLTNGRATNLDNLDAAITAIKAKTDNLPPSPASTGDVQVTVSGGFTTDDRIKLNAIPTTVYTTTLSTILTAVQARPINPLLTDDARLNFLNASIAAIPIDKTGYTLTGGERTAIAVAVETQLVSEFEALPTAVEVRQEVDSNSTKLTAIEATVTDLSDLRGFTNGTPMTANKDTGVIQAGNKRLVVTENGTTQTYTRSDV